MIVKLSYYIAYLLLILSSLYGEESKKTCEFDPIFYGTLLELPSINNSPGETTLEPYLYGGVNYGNYTNNWSLNKAGQFGVINVQLYGYIGITKSFQIDFTLEEQSIFFNNQSTTNLSDSFLGFGFQLLWQKKTNSNPNMRILIGEVFPTGKYQNLGSTFNGNNTTGNGSYGTMGALIIEKTFFIDPCHPFNINLNLIYTYFAPTRIHGINTYGGGRHTNGKINPGNPLVIALALEYCFTQKYLFALDFQYTHTFPAKFKGYSGFNPDGTIASILTGSQDLFTVTPAIEFGITPNLCIYLGGYFTVAGKNNNATAAGNFTIEGTF